MKASRPGSEASRLEALHQFHILDTHPEAEFDDLVRLAARLCAAPVALISFVDERREWIKAQAGVTLAHIPRETAPGAHVVAAAKLLTVQDACADERFAASPLVTGPPHMRFYAGAPLITREGHALGTLCVIDRVPRELSEEQQESLLALARQVVALLELRRDASERQRAEEALRESNELVSSILESVTDAFIALAHDWSFAYVNPKAERLLLRARDELIGKTFWEEFPGAAGTKWFDLLHQAMAEQKTVEFEEVLAPLDNWLEVCAHPVSGGLYVYFRDITRRKQLEEQLLQSQKMEAVGRLAGGIAHDFNNLLTTINGYSELTLRQLAPGDPLHNNVEEIRKAASRAASLTSQLLAFSRRQVLQPKVLDLNAVVSDTGKMLRRLIGEDIELVTILDSEAGRVKADPHQIEQVLMNLAVNARDAMPDGGQLIIETMNVELDEEYAGQHISIRPGPYVMLAVSDTGDGMDEETQSRIFEPFFTTKERGRGTGLGLSTVYGIVKQSDGYVWVYSEPGRGTTFKIYLPRVEEEIEAIEPSAAPTDLLWGTETILLVEDEEGVRKITREALELNGYRVLEAAGGAEAQVICKLHEGRIDLMVTDMIMPQMSGRELAERLASLRPEMKVLYISGYTENAVLQQGLEAGMAFLQKPFTLEALTQKVREVLDKGTNQELSGE
jgi:PAS domain S-box-containing protein